MTSPLVRLVYIHKNAIYDKDVATYGNVMIYVKYAFF